MTVTVTKWLYCVALLTDLLKLHKLHIVQHTTVSVLCRVGKCEHNYNFNTETTLLAATHSRVAYQVQDVLVDILCITHCMIVVQSRLIFDKNVHAPSKIYNNLWVEIPWCVNTWYAQDKAQDYVWYRIQSLTPRLWCIWRISQREAKEGQA